MVDCGGLISVPIKDQGFSQLHENKKEKSNDPLNDPL